jgi:hypothetical protein
VFVGGSPAIDAGNDGVDVSVLVGVQTLGSTRDAGGRPLFIRVA